jgi:hypothetical protein
MNRQRSASIFDISPRRNNRRHCWQTTTSHHYGRSMKPLLIISFCLFTSPACKEDEPPCTTCPPQVKDPRTYSWTVDTISYPGSFQTLMTRMWASGPDNVLSLVKTPSGMKCGNCRSSGDEMRGCGREEQVSGL